MEHFHYAAGLVPLNFEKNEWKKKKKRYQEISQFTAVAQALFMFGVSFYLAWCPLYANSYASEL